MKKIVQGLPLSHGRCFDCSVEKRPQYLIRRKGRLGQPVWYVWRRPAKQIRLREAYGTRAFWAEYRAALYGDPKPDKEPENAPNTLATLIAAYRRSPAWTTLADATRRQRGNMLDRIASKAGDMDVADVDRRAVAAQRDAMRGYGAAKCFIDTFRGLFKWAVETGEVEDNPTLGVKRPSTKTDGWDTWTDADIAAYQAIWPVGTRERLWLALLLFTGLRLSDAVKLGPSHVKAGWIETVTGKTGTPVTIPLHPDLKAVLAASPLGKRSFIGMTENTFGRSFRKACDAAGVAGSAHGLRKAAAKKLGEAGATVLELNAIFGWTGAKMALKYTGAADRAKLAKSGMDRLTRVTTS